MVKRHPAGLRIALLADTHGFLDTRLATEITRCDMAIHAGDIGSHAILQTLHDCVDTVLAVRGNNDVAQKWPVDDMAVLRKLPATCDVDLPGGHLSVVHGENYRPGRRHADLRRAFPEARAVVYGHSHRLSVDKDARPWVLNPGAAGRARTYGGPSCLILSASARTWRITQRRFTPLRRR